MNFYKRHFLWIIVLYMVVGIPIMKIDTFWLFGIWFIGFIIIVGFTGPTLQDKIEEQKYELNN